MTNNTNLKKVLIITNSIDCTVDYIEDKYKNVAEYYRLNVDKFSEYKISIENENQWIIECNKWMLKKKDLYSIYYRKPRLPKLDVFESDYRGMISRNIMSLINGIVDDFEGKVLSKPFLLRKTENEVFQLLYAQKKGLNVPKSYIGNNNKLVSDFLNKKSIIKPIAMGKIIKYNSEELFHTNYISNFDDDISLSPVYLQEYENKKYEVRLTVINSLLFAVRIDSEDKLDWRRSYDKIRYTLIECPKNIEILCLKILNDFGLVYGAFDFIVNENDEWVFLEVNPNGQWQWLEVELNLSISKEIINYLIS